MKMNWLNLCFEMAEGYIPRNIDVYDIDYKMRSRFTDFCSHAESIANHYSYAGVDEAEQKRTLHVLLYLSFGYYSIAIYEKAEELARATLRKLGSLIIKDEPLKAAITEKSLVWYYKDLKICENILGTEHTGTAASYYNIGTVFVQQEKFNEALDWICRAVIVLSICNMNSHPHMDLFSKALQFCFGKASVENKDFESWYSERVETYRCWCVNTSMEGEQHD